MQNVNLKAASLPSALALNLLQAEAKKGLVLVTSSGQRISKSKLIELRQQASLLISSQPEEPLC